MALQVGNAVRMAYKYAIKTAYAYNNTWIEILHQEVRMAAF